MTVLLGLDTRLKMARLLVVTDARSQSDDLGSYAGGIVAGGADIVLLSDPSLKKKAEMDALGVLRKAAQPRQAIVAVSGDADLAGEFGADMLVLADDGSSAAKARRRLHQWALIGRSCHTHADVDAALADAGVDFLIVTAALGLVRYAATLAPQGDPASKPWFAAGGVTIDYVGALVEAGCRRIAVSRALSKAKAPQAAAAGLASALKRAWDDDPAMERIVLNAFGRPTSRRTSEVDADTDGPDAGDGFGSLSNPFKNAKFAPPPADGPQWPDAAL